MEARFASTNLITRSLKSWYKTGCRFFFSRFFWPGSKPIEAPGSLESGGGAADDARVIRTEF
jgi:hypothetical protein